MSLQITTKDFPASNGWPALYPYHGIIDADVVKLMKASHAVQFGLTTIPPIASGISGWMWESGLCLNPCMCNFCFQAMSARYVCTVMSE